MLRRDRDARRFEIGLSTQGNHYEDRREVLLETIRNNLHKSGLLTADEISLCVDWDNPKLPMTSLSPDPDFELMAVELTAQVNAARNDFANNFVCQLMADNYNVARMAQDEEGAKAGRAEVAIAKEAIDARVIALHEAAATATEEQAAALTQKAMHQGITEEERASLNRYMLEHKLFVPVTPENILWLNRDAWQHVSNFELLHAPSERMHAYVQAQINAGVAVHKARTKGVHQAYRRVRAGADGQAALFQSLQARHFLMQRIQCAEHGAGMGQGGLGKGGGARTMAPAVEQRRPQLLLELLDGAAERPRARPAGPGRGLHPVRRL